MIQDRNEITRFRIYLSEGKKKKNKNHWQSIYQQWTNKRFELDLISQIVRYKSSYRSDY